MKTRVLYPYTTSLIKATSVTKKGNTGKITLNGAIEIPFKIKKGEIRFPGCKINRSYLIEQLINAVKEASRSE